MSCYYYNGVIEINNDEMYVEIEVHAKAHGYYYEGDRWGYGCEPPYGDFKIDEVKYISATTYDEDGNASSVEITDEMKDFVMNKLYEEDFDECEPESYYDDCYE